MHYEKELYSYLDGLIDQPFSCGYHHYRIKEFGNKNEEDGPDFLHALVLCDNKPVRAEIELHVHSRDWYNHFHHVNPRYDHVLLHLVWNNNLPVSFVFNSAGNKIPTFELESLTLPVSPQSVSLCPNLPSKDELIDNLVRMGLNRFQLRLQRFEKQIVDTGWDQAFYAQCFRNLMYRKNLHLPVLISYEDLQIYLSNYSVTEVEYCFLAAYGYSSPDDNSSYFTDYLRFLEKEEIPIRHNPLSLAYCRPANYPMRRFCGLIRMFSHSGGYLYDFWKKRLSGGFKSWNQEMKIFSEEIERPLSFWHEHTGPAASLCRTQKLIGLSRLKNLVYNSFLPFFLLRARLSGDKVFSEILEKQIHSFPVIETNYREKEMKRYLDVKKVNRAIIQYGLLVSYENCFLFPQKKCQHCMADFDDNL